MASGTCIDYAKHYVHDEPCPMIDDLARKANKKFLCWIVEISFNNVSLIDFRQCQLCNYQDRLAVIVSCEFSV